MAGRSPSADDVRQPAPVDTGVRPAWHERAKRAVVTGRSDPHIVSEAESLARSGQLTQRDLRMLLLMTDDDPAWRTARRLAVEGLRGTPEVPQQILTTHAQLEFWPPLTYEESAEHLPDGHVLHTAAVRLGPCDAQVTGPARSARTAALARRCAAEAILRRLAGVGDSEGENGGGRLTVPGMGTEAFESLLRTRVTTGDEPGEELAADVVRRAGSARLRHRDVHLLLFGARGPAWRELRVRALGLAARMQNSAATLLRWQADEQGAELRHTVVASEGGFSCRWSWEVGDGEGRDHGHGRTVDGAERTARDRRQAVHLGAVALLAELTALPEPEGERAPDGGGASRAVRIQPVPAGQDPVKYLNKYTQLEVISKPESTFTAAPKSAGCTYTCTLVRTGAEVSVTRRAKTRAEARRAAASALMEELVARDATPTPPTTAPASGAGTGPGPGLELGSGAGLGSRSGSGLGPGSGLGSGSRRPAVPGPRSAEGGPTVGGRTATSDSGSGAGPGTAPSSTPGSAPDPGPGSVPVPAPAPALRIAVGDIVAEALAAGCAVSFLPGGGAPAALLLHRPDGAPLPDVALPAPLAPARRSLLVPPATTPVPVAGWRVPLAEALPVLLRRHRDAAWHPTAMEWERAARLGLRAVAAGLVHPALGPDGSDRWRMGPLPAPLARSVDELARRMSPLAHAVADGGRFLAALDAVPAFLDALADTMLRPPAAVLFGSGPFLAPAGGPLPEAEAALARPWLDAVEDRLYSGPPPGLVVEFAAPSDEEAAAGRLTGRLLVAVDPGKPDQEVPAGDLRAAREPVAGVEPYHLRERVRLRIRRAARRCGLLAGLLTSPGRLVADATGIGRLLEAEPDLAAEGVLLRWPPGLRDLLSAHTVVGTEDVVAAGEAPGPQPTGGAPRFSLQALLDFRWRFALGGDVLSEAEMDALAEAARPLVRVRGRWVLLDPLTVARVRRREIGPLAGIDALTAALTGTVRVDGRTVPCRAGGGLAAVVDVLRRGEHAPPVPPPAGLAATLRGYQERALAWLAHTGGIGFGAVLADDMGLGKTLTAIAYTLHRYENGRRGPVLVVCPSSLVTNWEREFRRFAPQLDVTVYHGTRRSLDVAGERTVVLTTHGVLRRDDELTSHTWDLVIADEAQHAKNHTSSIARRLHALTSTTRLALSGTPVENNLSELWTLLDWANPGLFGPLKTFRSRYAAAAERDPDGPAARALARLIAPFLLRRRKTDPRVAPELPAKVETRRIVELTAEQVALYEAVVRETMEQLAHSPALARSGLVFKLITALKQITNHPAHYWGEDHPGPSGAGEFTARSAKLEALGELVEAITARGEAALVFTSYVTMGRLLTEHLTHLGHRPLFLHGGLDTRRRQELVDAFQAGRSPLFVLSLKAGGTGLTLTRASHVVHFDRSWNAAVEDQASDRAHRIGQRRTVTVHRLVTRGTIEDRIDQLLTHKRALQETVLGTGDAGIARLSDRELVDLVSLGDPS
ncbi:SNF2-related protein [Streptomyces sp. TX20-6-3]|uniref:SNF2-related protein n=1 Tax=Streptomyces sp. TX20-6-3 TaxID=3028705 RepID=UPI0029AC02A6|nr:SNF2-related protein [Streptomyces sp. TX20-6-3]MDX2562059.1 SNF2-related protein [Streptomyces sp. TX20-6-3]